MPNFPYLPPDYCMDCGKHIEPGTTCPCYAGSLFRRFIGK